MCESNAFKDVKTFKCLRTFTSRQSMIRFKIAVIHFSEINKYFKTKIDQKCGIEKMQAFNKFSSKIRSRIMTLTNKSDEKLNMVPTEKNCRNNYKPKPNK